MSHRWLIGLSLVAALGVAAVALGANRHVERLQVDAATLAGITMSPPEPSEGPATPQPAVESPPEVRVFPDGEGCGFWGTCEETPAVCGDGQIGSGEQCDDGDTIDGDGCSSTCVIERGPQILLIAPRLLSRLRVSGDTRIEASPAFRERMQREGRDTVISAVKVCVSAEGIVTSATMLKSTHDDAHDAAMLSALRAWRFRPYHYDGVAIPVCSTVSSRFKVDRGEAEMR